MLKFSLMLASAVCACLNLSAALAVDGVTVVPHRPWDKQVDVFVKLSGAEDETEYKVQLTANYTGCPTGGLVAKALAGDPVVKGNGTHRLVWNLDQDAPGLIADNFTVTADVTPFAATDPVYLVIDLSAGPTATSYPTRYSFVAPDLSDDTCRTTELWLKRVPAGTFTMGKGTGGSDALAAHAVKLSKPFYMAVFPTTQKQWERVMGTWPSYFTNADYRDVRPVEQVLWSDVRGHGGWYSAGTPGATTFIGKLQSRSGISGVEIPSNAQWEYVCRAGTTGDYYFNGEAGQVRAYARTADWDGTFTSDPECDLTAGTAKVGSYPANPWGFYDFYGNVCQMVPDGASAADWKGMTFPALTADPRWAFEGDKNYTFAGIRCGSNWTEVPGQVFSARRKWTQYQSMSGDKGYGFRMCVNIE